MALYLCRMCIVLVTGGAWVTHRYAYAPPRYRISQDRREFYPLSVSMWYDITDLVIDSVLQAGIKSSSDVLLIGLL